MHTIVMPASKKNKGKKGKRGAKTSRDSASKEKAKRLEDGFTAAERCEKRLARQTPAQRIARENREWSLGEQVINNKLIRDDVLKRLNPFKLSDLQSVLGLREFYKVLSDVDLKDCYFGSLPREFQGDDFVLANWREMSVWEMKDKVRDAHKGIPYPPDKVEVYSLETKEEIVRAFWELTCVPRQVYRTAVGGSHVLRLVRAGKVGKDPTVAREYILWACRAGLEASVIRGLAEKCGEGGWDANDAAESAAACGHIDVLDLLADEFGAQISQRCWLQAVCCCQYAMAVHLFERYGVNGTGVRLVADDASDWTDDSE